jgi:hypothetical protein
MIVGRRAAYPAVVADRSHRPVEAAPILIGYPASKLSHLVNAWRHRRAVLRKPRPGTLLALVRSPPQVALTHALGPAQRLFLVLARLASVVLVATVLKLVTLPIVRAAIAFAVVAVALSPVRLIEMSVRGSEGRLIVAAVELSLLRSGGKPLCDNFSIFRVRLARADERALYRQNPPSILAENGELAVLLVELDDPA